MIEWYDFYIFGSLAAVALPEVLSVRQRHNCVDCLLIDLRGWIRSPAIWRAIFGRIGDLVGRKYAFLVTLSIMGGATALIGLLPTYKTAGWFAPVALLAIRVLQGLALGGEYGGAAV